MLALVGALLLAGHAAHFLGRRLHVPRVTLLIVIGVICGPYGLDVIPASLSDWFPYVAHFALAMIGFLLGESFIGRELKTTGREVLLITMMETLRHPRSRRVHRRLRARRVERR